MSVNWQLLYDGPFHHPGLAWAFALSLLARLQWRFPRSTLRVVLVLLIVETALDALVTGALSPLPKGSPLAQPLSIAFVILGDFRFFLLLEKFRSGASWRVAALRAAAFAFVVPVAQALAIKAAPELFTQERHIYLVYEALFVALAATLLLLRYPSRAASSPALGWYATRLTAFFLVQYALWVLSDVLILQGQAWALGLRLVPNAMYYGLFLFFAAFKAPEEAWR